MEHKHGEPTTTDPTQVSLAKWLQLRHGTRTGTYTFNGVVYTDMNEVEWRLANHDWS